MFSLATSTLCHAVEYICIVSVLYEFIYYFYDNYYLNKMCIEIAQLSLTKLQSSWCLGLPLPLDCTHEVALLTFIAPAKKALGTVSMAHLDPLSIAIDLMH